MRALLCTGFGPASGLRVAEVPQAFDDLLARRVRGKLLVIP
jgi:hypothetical protein